MRAIRIESQPWGWSHAIEARFQPLVERLETEAAADPRRYRRRVVAGALLGYAVLFGTIAALLAIIAAIAAFAWSTGRINVGEVKLILIAALPAWLVLRALWIKLDPPHGRAITAAEAPELFASIERMRAATGGPDLHAVLITDDFNASIVQHPRLGLFGGHRNYLMLGLPLLQAVDTRAFEAVLAHEFGHLANADGKLGSWIYRVRMTWARLSESLGSGGTGAIMRRFFAWYGPWFNAYSFVLARQNEYAADRMSARATSPADAARALATVAVEADRFRNQHWQAIFDAVDHHDAPPALPFAGARSFFAAPGAGRSGPLARALAVPTGLDDTHPALAQRLAALGEPAPEPAPCLTAAADTLFPDGGRALAAEFDTAWWDANAEAWRERRDNAQAARARLAALDAAAADVSIAPADRFDHAWLTEWLVGGSAAEPMYAALVDNPGEPADLDLSRWALLRLRLARGDGTALADLDRLVAEPQSPRDIEAFIAQALGYFDAHAPTDPRRQDWLALAARNEARSQALTAELNHLDTKAALGGADLTAAQRQTLASIGADFPEIVRIDVASRALHHGPPDRQHILLFQAGSGMGPDRVNLFMDAALAVLEPSGPALAIQSDKDRRWLQKRVSRDPTSLVYDRRRTR